jgi:hypothetical protein
MTIHYSNGKSVEAILLNRTDNSMRVALRGSDDIAEFHEVNGFWVSENCELVDVEFAWMRHAQLPAVTEADCVCSQELASRLIHLLYAGEKPEKPAMVLTAGGGRRVS